MLSALNYAVAASCTQAVPFRRVSDVGYHETAQRHDFASLCRDVGENLLSQYAADAAPAVFAWYFGVTPSNGTFGTVAVFGPGHDFVGQQEFLAVLVGIVYEFVFLHDV